MDNKDTAHSHLLSFLNAIPPVDFCCVYGSTLHSTGPGKSTMVDYILGVSDPLQWHSENLKMNADHYASWMVLLGGAKLVLSPSLSFICTVLFCFPSTHTTITNVADKLGVGVHFNPYVTWNDKMLKYGVVRMHDLIQDILNWESFYLSGRLQKPVNMLVDNLDIETINSVNLRAAVSAALLLLPPKFTEEDLYAKICSLSYMGDVRMLFAEDRNKVKKIVQGQFDLFQSMYKPFLEEYEGKDFLRFSSSKNQLANISQDCGLPVTHLHISFLPPTVRSQMGMKIGKKKVISESGKVGNGNDLGFGSREEAAKCMQKALRRTVMVSSARQAVSGVLTVGGVKAARYLTSKMCKAWRSWTRT
ncbi:phosphatidate cytidylyltransferase, mitochondrial-like isoform X1 [Gossypium australe]|uniref:Phosphatidate cytidylyltransferase, mitochondrial n=1 Tax=Gossypium australe TaxID=47621 RepID=A0A5B6W1M3_9ROSI|nr:phosphatidate cytidylyltransferase, mitochondrial-like isoform X1 [Gossypium australe]